MSILAWTIEIIRPAMLLMLMSLLAVVWYYRRSLVDFPIGQMRLSLAVRCLLLILLILAAAGLNLLHDDTRLFVIFLIDRSDSIDDESTEQANRFVTEAMKNIGRKNEAGIIEFAGNTSGPRPIDSEAVSLPELDRSHTDLASAISVAWASIPAFYAKKLVVLSDGQVTRGDALGVSHAARLAGVRLSTIPLKANTREEVQLAKVHTNNLTQVRSGAPFKLFVEINSNHEDVAELELYRNDIRMATNRVSVKSGVNRFQFRQVASSDKFQSYSVRLRANNDHFVDNNISSALISCEGKPRVLLIVESDTGAWTSPDARYLTQALRQEDIEVEVRGPRGVPRTLADLENFDLLCLINVAATDLTKRQMQLIRSYVQDLGGGLIMVGGDQSFGLGGYYKTVLEDILPVRSDFEKEKEKPDMAMVLVIDKSGSMGGQKIELAKDAAKSAVELLGRRDKVGVIAFDGDSQWISQIHPVSDRNYVLDRISSLVAGGGTNLAPALSDSYSALEGTRAKIKHVIVLTDGHSQPGNFYDIVSSMASSKITVSTVAVGSGADRELLERIADWGQGRTYFTEDPSHIPQIFARETMEASKSAINEQPFLAQQIISHQICEGLNLDTSPLLLGYVITKLKPTAELVLGTESGHPLLAMWRYGLGKSLAFTSDAKNRWAAEWVNWEGFSRFWSQVVRDTMRTSSHTSMEVSMERNGEKVHVSVDALHPSPQHVGEYLDDVETSLELIRPGITKEVIELRQTSPGRYEGEFSVEDEGSYHVRIPQQQQGVLLQSTTRGIAVGYSDEYCIRPTDEKMLKQLADVGGGVYDLKPWEVFKGDTRSVRVQPLWPWLLGAALILLILDVGLRRVDLLMTLGRVRSWQRLSEDV
ncbi:MAG: VWA domain-containing protein [Planctomycetota bacterium]